VGYGIKTQQQLYFPIGPSDLNEEGEDIIEFPEPNPKDPPDEIEPDSDDIVSRYN
jgi:radial spoke head protein 4A